MTKKLLAGVALLAVVLAIFAITHFSGQPRPAAAPAVVMGGPKDLMLLPILADKKGFFKEKGLDCHIDYLQTGKVSMDSLLSGDIQLGVIVDVNVAFIKYRQGANLGVLAGIGQTSDDGLLARRDRQITSPADLQKKKVGYLPATTSHVFLSRFCDANKIPIDSLQLLPMSPPAMEAAIVQGDVDAICVFQPFRYNALQKLGDKGIDFHDKDVYSARALLAATDGYIKSHPDECSKALGALIQAEDFLQKNPREAFDILAREMELDPKVLEAIAKQFLVRVELDAQLLPLIRAEGEWIKKSQKDFADQAVPAYDDVIRPELLKKLAPDRVSEAR